MLKPHDITVTNKLLHFVGYWQKMKSDTATLMFCDESLLIRLETAKKIRRKPSEKVTPNVKRIS